jgi:ATP-dependent protease ClpP protease subunit
MNISQVAVQRIMNLRQGRKDWYEIRSQAGATVVTIYDEVGYFGVSAKDFSADMKQIRGDIELHISSGGGEVFDGLAIYNCLSARDGQVRVVVDSLAGSICSVIAQAASPGELIMAEASSMMIHEGWGGMVGNAADMRQMADVLDKQSDVIASVYAARSGKPAPFWRDQMRAETWYGAQEAVDAGLADEVRAARPGSPRNSAPRPPSDPAKMIRDAFEGGTR